MPEQYSTEMGFDECKEVIAGIIDGIYDPIDPIHNEIVGKALQDCPLEEENRDWLWNKFLNG